jgi:hypothetical protein
VAGRQVENCVVLEYTVQPLRMGSVVFAVAIFGREVCQVDDDFGHVFPIVTVLIVAKASQINDLSCVYSLKPLDDRLGYWRQLWQRKLG